MIGSQARAEMALRGGCPKLARAHRKAARLMASNAEMKTLLRKKPKGPEPKRGIER